MVRKLFLTPPSLPGETECRSLNIPSSRQWLGIFNQALLQLANQYNYEQVNDTDMLPEDVAAICYDAYQDWLMSSCAVPGDVPTPYWDEDSEVDDESDPASQVWYGEVLDPTVAPTSLTFVENAAIWTFTGLLAIAGAVPAALAFNTIAPRFVISIRNGDLGNVVRLFVDGAEYYSQTDDGSGDVTDVSVIADDTLDTHQIYLTVGET